MKLSKRALALLAALALFAAACGSDDDSDDTSTGDETEETTESTEAPTDDAGDETEETTESTEAPAEDDAPADDDATEEDDEAMEEDDGAAGAGTIVDVATANGSFTTLLAAADAAGLVETLSGPGPFTVFAPTDAAFEAALADLGLTAEELLASDDLAGILTYHVIPSEVPSADVAGLDGQSVTTVNGADVTVTVDGDTVMINDATVTAVDVEADNGVIHVIDKVLLPPS